MNRWVRGQAVRVSAQVFSTSNVLVNAGTITVKVTDPKGKITTYTGGSVINDGTGLYHVDVATASDLDAQLGTWVYAYQTTSPDTAGKGAFEVVSEYTQP